MNRERFSYLFERYKNNLLSQEEWEELQPALQSGMYDEFLKDDLLRLVRGEGAVRTQRPVIRRIVRVGIAVAACMLLCFGLLWLLRPASAGHGTAVAAASKAPANIQPGSNKAILTLSNGQRIVLDSIPNGMIAKQGVTTITRVGGQVGYAADAKSGGDREATGTAAGEVLYNTITTPKGGQYAVVLADGSKVWLNSASSLRFPTVFNGAERAVQLTGEGYFEIAKNARMPFFVQVNEMKVQVLGTHFNVMAYSDEPSINTTLLEGAIAVQDGAQTQRLQPGQQVALGADHRMLVKQADIEKTMAWKNGFFEFDQMDLAAIMRQVARWYDVDINYQSTIDHTALGGSISKNLGLSEVLNLLETNGGYHFKIEGKKVCVTQTR